MQPFSGYLDRYECRDGRIVARFLAGTTEPEPREPPVLTVTVEPEGAGEIVLELLKHLKERSDWLYLYHTPGAPLQIESEFGDEHSIEDNSLSVVRSAYEAEDFARLARTHYEDAMNQREIVRSRALQLARIRDLITDQCTRIETKSRGHEVGTTAHTLYEQHLSFLQRLLGAAEA
jgi:hypothetical protein